VCPLQPTPCELAYIYKEEKKGKKLTLDNSDSGDFRRM
jgi:hypothetical protein